MTKEIRQIPLNDYKTGNRIGTVGVTQSEYANIEARAQSPEGVFRADSLAPEEWANLGLKADQTVYFDGTWFDTSEIAAECRER